MFESPSGRECAASVKKRRSQTILDNREHFFYEVGGFKLKSEATRRLGRHSWLSFVSTVSGRADRSFLLLTLLHHHG